MGILEILSQLLEFIRQVIWPLWIVSEPNKAVWLRFGQPRGIREPDWYFAWPWADELRMVNCAEDTIDVANIPFTARDGIQATVSYNIRLKIKDPMKYVLNLRGEADPKKSDTLPSAIHAECSTAVSSMMRRRKWDQIYKSQGAIERRITAKLTNTLADWGVEVIAGGITICSQAIPLALINVD